MFRNRDQVTGALLAILWCSACVGQTTQYTFPQRVESAIRYAIPASGAEGRTNEVQVRQQWVQALKAATPEQLRSPQLLPSLYGPESAKDGHVLVQIAWLQDVPSLSEVTLVNPKTKQQFVVRIPDDALKLRREWASETVLHIYGAADVPVEVTGTDANQELQLQAPDGQISVVYPCNLDESNPFRTFEQRLDGSILRLPAPQTANEKTVRGEWIKALKAATPDALRTAQLLPSVYYRAGPENDKVRMEICWLEDEPSLREVTLVNPVSQREFVIRIPDDELARIRDSARFVVLHRAWIADVPAEIVGSHPDQPLELRAPDGQSTAVYPSGK